MDHFSSKKADTYLTNDLHTLLVKVKQLESLNRQLAQYLEPNIAPYCQVANRVGSRLVLVVANGSIATQLRFQTPDLIQKLSHDPLLEGIKEIQCKVRLTPTPPSRLSHSPTNTLALLSPETAKTIQEMAESLEDPQLKNIMQRIAEHTKE